MDIFFRKKGCDINMEKKQKNKKNDYAIKIVNVSKKFKLFYDKHYTLKEKMVFWKNKKADIHEVLKDISLNIKKGE